MDKERIIQAMEGIPADSLIHYIVNGDITFEELESNGLSNFPEKYAYVKQHIGGAIQKMIKNEDSFWAESKQQATIESLQKYKNQYPHGRYIQECEDMLADMPWTEAVRINTIDGYQLYMQQYPNKHVAEARAAIVAIEDENDWRETERYDTKEKYVEYIEKRPNGKHVLEAKERINRPLGEKEVILQTLIRDHNAYRAYEIQQKVGNHILKWEDLNTIFTFAQIQAIQNWSQPAQLPLISAPEDLLKDSTEVYFWGTKGTGKTCVLGSILSAAKWRGFLEPQSCKARLYLDQLSNIFTLNGNCKICNLPESNPDGCIFEMVIKLEDDKQRQHKMTLIDLAGEAVTGIYKKRNGLPLLDIEKEAVDHIMHYLNNPYNNKIHFFVLEYGSADKYVETKGEHLNVTQCDVLQDVALFLKENKCLQTSTVGVYVLVTKSDKIDVEENSASTERPKRAHDYVKKKFPSFFNQLKNACGDNKLSEFKTISYSIGDVFLQNLCEFRPEDSDKVIKQLLLKTRPESHWRFWERLLN